MLEQQKFKIQETRMTNFLDWLRGTVHSIVEISDDNYQVIFNKISDKAVYEND